jgi:hypothetical protein
MNAAKIAAELFVHTTQFDAAQLESTAKLGLSPEDLDALATFAGDCDLADAETEVLTLVRAGNARLAGARLGRAIARDVNADADLPTAWSDDDLSGDDAASLELAGVRPGTDEWDVALDAARVAYRESLAR